MDAAFLFRAAFFEGFRISSQRLFTVSLLPDILAVAMGSGAAMTGRMEGGLLKGSPFFWAVAAGLSLLESQVLLRTGLRDVKVPGLYHGQVGNVG
jgi:hypothetical protein